MTTSRPTPPLDGGHGETSVPADWTQLPLEHLPASTFWPAGFALAITFLFWGLITSWVVLTAGLVLFIWSLAGWIAEMRHERREHIE